MKVLFCCLLTLILASFVACGNSAELTTTTIDTSTGHWKIGENWIYSPQSISGSIFVALEIERDETDNSITNQYITTCNLKNAKTTRILEIDPEIARINAPVIYANLIVWDSANVSVNHSGSVNWETLDRDIYLYDMGSGVIEQITDDDYYQVHPVISDDTIVWLDARNNPGNDLFYDVYAFDLKTQEEMRITDNATVKSGNLAISGNRIAWADYRNDLNYQNGNWSQDITETDIYSYNIFTNIETRISSNTLCDVYPFLSGDFVGWIQKNEDTSCDLFIYDFDQEVPVQITDSGSVDKDFQPTATENYLIWADSRMTDGNNSFGSFTYNDQTDKMESGSSEVFAYDLEDEKEELLVPSYGSNTSVNYEGRELQATEWEVLTRPVIEGNYVVYSSVQDEGYDLYTIRVDI